MIIKPDYTKYTKRLTIAMYSVVYVVLSGILFLSIIDYGRIGFITILLIFTGLIFITSKFALRKSKNYIGEIIIVNDSCEFKVYEYDKPNKRFKTKLSETRIKIWEYFPTGYFRNHKLIIETKQGLIFKPIIIQYEIGNWDLEKFKEVLNLYGEVKGVSVSSSSFKRTGI